MRYKNLVAFLNTLVLIFFFVSLRPAPPVANAQSSIGTEIVSLATEKCLDVASGSVTSGADVNQFRCHEGANQRWTAHNASTPGYVFFRNQNSNLCLDVRIGGPKNGTLQQFTCHQGNNQLFRIEPFTDALGGARIVAKHSGQCLDVPSGRSEDRLFIQQFSCHSGPSQRWTYADNGPYIFHVSATPIGRQTLSLSGGQSYSFSLTNLPPGVVPFMHLWSQTWGNVTPPGQNEPATRVPILNYVVPAGRAGTYTLLVHAPPGVNAGMATLTVRQNNSFLNQYRYFPFGGTVVDVPRSSAASQFRYETVELPGGVANTLILALDDSNRLTGFDDDSGLGLASRITGVAGTSRIVVGTVMGMGIFPNVIGGPSVLYANDIFRDLDHDGIGYGLERELGTCDRKNAQPRCASVFNPQDTDRDGIEDGVEVFGVEDGALYFPKWGANPLHKDLYVEADWLVYPDQPDPPGPRWPNPPDRTPLNRESIRRMQETLAHGPAAHLDNPDGRPGLALHVDAGIWPTDPADRTLYGAWGGANQVPLALWQGGPPAGSFDQRRLRYFRQLLLLRAGGSTPVGRFWYATGEDPDTIMHEFGHTLDLQHESFNGGVNCSPTYPSIMSYGPKSPQAFSTGGGFPPEGRNPSSLCEADGLGPGIPDPSFITTILNGIRADSSGIDWNRDGSISGTAPAGSASRCRPEERVRAVINWCPAGGDAYIKGNIIGGTVLSPEVASAGRPDGGDVLGGPAMTRVGTRLYVFYVKRNASGAQSLFYQSALIGPKLTAGCTDGFKVYPGGSGDPCMHFAGPFEIALRFLSRPFMSAPISPSRVAIFPYGNGLQVAVADEFGQIRLFNISAADLEAGRNSRTVFPGPILRNRSGSVINTNSDLSFAEVSLDRAIYGRDRHHLALYYVDRAGAVGWASRGYGNAGELIDRGPVLDLAGAPLITTPGDSPAIASWTAVGKDNLELYLANLESYMVLQRQDARLRLFRFDRARDRWGDVTQVFSHLEFVDQPGHNQKIGFWFQHILDGNGEIIRPGSGFFSILFRRNGPAGIPGTSTARMWRSENVSSTSPPSQSLRFGVFQNFGHGTYEVRGNNYPLGLGGGFAVYCDETMPGLKAALVKWDADDKDPFKGYDLLFLPFADGIFDLDFKPMSDFKVMEGMLCRVMRGEVFCGTPAQTKWGF